MRKFKRSLLIGGLGAGLLCAGEAVLAQDADNSTDAVIGPPQLRDFQLEPQQRIVTQPEPQAPPPVRVAPPPPTATQPRAEAPRRAAPAPAAQTRRQPQREAEPAVVERARAPEAVQAPPADIPAPVSEQPAPPPVAMPEPQAVVPVAQAEEGGRSWWLYLLPAAALALLGVALVRRRRRPIPEPASAPVPIVAAPPPPRPEPVPRPWLELSLKAERATATDSETVVLFELEISNTGGSDARNVRIDVKMFNAGREQDKEIGAFFRTAGRESTKLNLPLVEAGSVGVIHGQVTMPREEMRAVKLDDKTIFIPVIAVNGLYDWSENRTGQTSKSYVIGRELEQQSEKMGAFRVDQGPRVWRSVGQRQHKLAKRV